MKVEVISLKRQKAPYAKHSHITTPPFNARKYIMGIVY